MSMLSESLALQKELSGLYLERYERLLNEKVPVECTETEDPQAVLVSLVEGIPPVDRRFLDYLMGVEDTLFAPSRTNLFLYHGINLRATKRNPLKNTVEFELDVLSNPDQFEAYNTAAENYNYSGHAKTGVVYALPQSRYRIDIEDPGETHGIPGGPDEPKTLRRAAGTLTVGLCHGKALWELEYVFRNAEGIPYAWNVLEPGDDLNGLVQLMFQELFGAKEGWLPEGSDPLDGIRMLLNGDKIQDEHQKPDSILVETANRNPAKEVKSRKRAVKNQILTTKTRYYILKSVLPSLSLMAGALFLVHKAIGGTNLNLLLAAVFLFPVPILLIQKAMKTADDIDELKTQLDNNY